jgi:type I restriction enzyme R subunit
MAETDARIIIDRLLREAGWDIEDKSQVSTEEPAADGRADYLLKDQRGRPLAVIEAKRFSIEPNRAQQQAKEYAESIAAPYIFLSNGEVNYFWDYKNDSSRLVDSFYSREDLERRNVLSKSIKPLKQISIPSNFLYLNQEITVRPYQVEAIQAVDKAIEDGKRRILIEMATGTGKTLTMAIIMKRLFEAGLVQRVLFLVDRKQLAEQTKNVFAEYLKDTPSKVWYGGKPKELGQIVIGTLPTIASQLERFGPGHFDLVVTDECHRSIYNVYRDLLNHFDALQIGMTATPNLGHYEFVNEKEKKLVRNTYEFYKCWNHATQNGEPTYAYGIVQGIKDGFLANYQIYLAKSRITAEGVSYEGVDYKPSELERTITIESRNKLMVQEFAEMEKQRGGDHLRKSIVFAVTKNHAAQLKRFFDEEFSQYHGNYAEIITSDTSNPGQILKNFEKQEFPICLISVGMLDTGIDLPNIENLIMMRPTVSVVLYQQMRGRGTRKDPKIGKESFFIYDFVGNAEKFNDPMLENAVPGEKGLPRELIQQIEEDEEKRKRKEFVVVKEGDLTDEMQTRQMIYVGPEGLAVDRQNYKEKFTDTIRKMEENHVVKRILADGPVEEDELRSLADQLNKPEDYFNEDNLKEAYGEPSGSLVDFIKVAFGKYTFPTKRERVNRNFDSWLRQKDFTTEQIMLLSQLKNRFVAGDMEITADDFTKPPLREQGGIQRAVALFGEQQLTETLNELNETVLI